MYILYIYTCTHVHLFMYNVFLALASRDSSEELGNTTAQIPTYSSMYFCHSHSTSQARFLGRTLLSGEFRSLELLTRTCSLAREPLTHLQQQTGTTADATYLLVRGPQAKACTKETAAYTTAHSLASTNHSCQFAINRTGVHTAVIMPSLPLCLPPAVSERRPHSASLPHI